MTEEVSAPDTGVDETPATETPSVNGTVDETPSDETPAGEETPDETPGETVEQAVASVVAQTSDATRLRAGELLASLENTVMSVPQEEWGDALLEIATEAGLLVPLLIAPVTECDTCRGKVVREAPPVVHADDCNLVVPVDQSQEDAEAALRAKIEAELPEAYRETVLSVELPKIAARYACSCGAAEKAAKASKSSGGTGTRSGRKAEKRMSAKVIDGKDGKPDVFSVSFPDEALEKTWDLPKVADVKNGRNVYEGDDAAARAALKRIKKEAEDWAVENGASDPGQKNAVGKGLTTKNYKING